jgi:hypothetical protein
LKHLTKLLGLTKKPLQCKDLQIFCTWVLTWNCETLKLNAPCIQNILTFYDN